jgi:hypothetical protein
MDTKDSLRIGIDYMTAVEIISWEIVQKCYERSGLLSSSPNVDDKLKALTNSQIKVYKALINGKELT